MITNKQAVLENQHLKLIVNTNKAVFTCLHKDAEEMWDSDPWQGSMGFMTFATHKGIEEQVNISSARSVDVMHEGDSLKLKMTDFATRHEAIREDRALGNKIMLEIEFRLDPVNAKFTFSINKLEINSKYWVFKKVVAPLRHFSARTVRDNGYFLIPANQGAIVPTRYNKGYFRYLNWKWEEMAGYNRELNMMSMPWFGGVKGNSGYTAIIETPYDAGIDIVFNNTTPTVSSFNDKTGEVNPGGVTYSPRITAVSPVWYASGGSFGYSRSCTYNFIRQPSIAKLAKIYRKYAIETGYFKSLKEKIAENPNVEKIIGGPDIKVFMVTNRVEFPEQRGFNGPVWDGYHEVSTTFSQLEDIAGDLGNMGIDRGMIHVGGWGNQGYDNIRPLDTLPVNEEAGGEKGFRKAAEKIAGLGMLTVIHDNYRNFDLNSPSYDESVIGMNNDGTLQIGFSSDGGPSHQICSTRMLPMLKKTSQYMADKIGATGYFLDTVTANPPQECFHPEHPVTRKEDVENKISLFSHLKEIGMVLGSEAGQYWGVPYCDFMEGMMGTHRMGIAIPLFNLVYHDAVVAYWQHAAPYNYEHPRGSFAEHVLMGLLYGNSCNWAISSYVYQGCRKQIKEVYELISEFHKRIALEEMVDFSFHSDDLLVQGSEFSDGTKVFVNFSPADYEIEEGNKKFAVPFRGYVLSYPDGTEETGQVEYSIERRGR